MQFPLALFNKIVAETVGTALLAFTIATAAGNGSSLAPIAIGSTLMTAIYAGGHISGAHYNPAVTLAVFIRGKLSVVEAICYVLAQLVGAFFGGCSGALILNDDGARPAIGAPNLGDGYAQYSAFIAEAVITFALAHVVLNVATTSAQANNSYYGLAIGFTVLSGAISVGSVSGGCFNPAIVMVTLARGITTQEVTKHVWIHIFGPLLGGYCAGFFFVIFQPREMGPDHRLGVVKSRSASLRKSLAPYAYEFVGTFLLCFTVACAASPRNAPRGYNLAPLSIGSMLMGQVYAGGAASGANYNPAVTLAVLVRKAEGIKDAFIYVLVQCIGALMAGGVARAVITDIGHPAPLNSAIINDGRAFWAECFGTFFLCYVVLQTATNSLVAGNSFFGLAIGYTVTAMAIAVGPLSGGAFNPAVSLLGIACCMNEELTVNDRLWIYWVAPPVGALIAGLLFRAISREEKVITNKSRKNLTESVGSDVGKRRKSMVHADPNPGDKGESFNRYFPSEHTDRESTVVMRKSSKAPMGPPPMTAPGAPKPAARSATDLEAAKEEDEALKVEAVEVASPKAKDEAKDPV